MFKRNLFFFVSRSQHRWVKPEGHDTGIKIYNCVTKDKQPLIVKNKNFVSWYTCGPTVYDSSHIGHACCFLRLDIIQKILKERFNLNIVTVMNITDVDDKIIARSNASQIPINQLTKQFENEFWKDLDSLEIRRPDFVLRVTENMEIIKTFISKLMEENKAYKSENSVYFDVENYDNYGKLQNLSSEPQAKIKYKKSPLDFALWKSTKPNEIFWESAWGEGRPGWHIECSALASHALGNEIDIHAGGIDLRFPHHENEEAQSCAFHNKRQWVNYWVHTGHLHLSNDEKMSKSLKNTISIEDLLKETTPEVFRLACLMSHYRKNMEFSKDLLKTASNYLQNYINCINNCHSYLNGRIKADLNNSALEKLINDSTFSIHEALIDDFNTPQIIQILNNMVTTVNGLLHSSRSDLNETKSVAIIGVVHIFNNTLNMLGIDMKKQKSCGRDANFENVMNILNDFRQDVRQIAISNKDKNVLQLCDNVRDNLKTCGIIIKDHGKLSSWS